MNERTIIAASPDDILYEVAKDENGWFAAPPVPIIAWAIDSEGCPEPITTDINVGHFVLRRGGVFWVDGHELVSSVKDYVDSLNR